MPSVEMRRSTRVFVPKAKDGDLVKVLRSGRRLWGGDSTPDINTNTNTNTSFKKYPVSNDNSNYKSPSPRRDEEKLEQVCRGNVRVIKNVYSRKRKRVSVVDGGLGLERQRFGLHFVRRKRRKGTQEEGDVFLIDVEPCGGGGGGGGCSVLSRLLRSLLTNLRNGRVGLIQLSAFLVSAPIGNIFASFGVTFLLNDLPMKKRGVCRIFKERQRVPLFTIDFSVVPSCFLSLHAILSLRSVYLSHVWWIENESTRDYHEPLMCTNGHIDEMIQVPVAPYRDDRGMKVVVAGLEAGKVGTRIVQYRSGVLARSSSKRRRRSLRNRRARNPSHFVMQKPNGGPPVCNSVVFKKNGGQSPMLCVRELRSSARKNPESKIGVPKSSPRSVIRVPKLSSNSMINVPKSISSSLINVPKPSSLINVPNSSSCPDGLNVDIDLNQGCAVNVLVVENDKCYKNIPVPGVSEVANFWNPTSAFVRPESYIRMMSDEMSRILSKRTANYDMDSEDEEWLSEFNSGLEDGNCLSEETYELMIDAFEKGSYFSSEGVTDEKAAVSLCLDLTEEEVTILVYRYWTKRREKKRAPLLRAFELNESRRAQLITKPVLRKKRSLKRATTSPSIQRGRGKDNCILEAMAVERTILEEQHAVFRAQEARALADKLVEVAILKRERAQFLMENADLAMYQATMAMRIADAATRAVDASHFLD